MISSTGTKTDISGFTLIEVLITVAILAVATVFISPANLQSGAVYGRYVNRLEMQNWAAEKIWEAKEAILSSEFPDVGTSRGTVTGKTRPYEWALEVKEQREKLFAFYEIRLDVSWKEGGQEHHAERYGAYFKVKD